MAGLRVTFGGLAALDGVDLVVPAGVIHGVIGPNGAGKTTLLNVLSRLQEPAAGRLVLEGCDLRAARPQDLSRLGVSRTFQHVELFGGLSVLDNVVLGRIARARAGFTGALLGSPTARRDLAEARERAGALLAALGLEALAHREATALPFPQQKLVGLARALAAEPRLLLLDEPAAGMTGAEVAGLRQTLARLRREGRVTILLVEHVMELVMQLCDGVTVLNHGRKIAEGPPWAVRGDRAVIEAYLGSRLDHA